MSIPTTFIPASKLETGDIVCFGQYARTVLRATYAQAVGGPEGHTHVTFVSYDSVAQSGPDARPGDTVTWRDERQVEILASDPPSGWRSF